MRLSNKQRQLLYFALLLVGLVVLPLHLITMQTPQWQTVFHRWLHFPLLGVYTLIVLLLSRATLTRSTLRRLPSGRAYIGIALLLFLHWVLPPLASAHPVLLLTQLWVSAALGVMLAESIPSNIAEPDPADMSVSRAWRFFFAAYILIAVILCVLLVSRVPRMMSFDEPAEISFAYSLVHSGKFIWPFYSLSERPEFASFTWGVDFIAGQFMQIVGFGAPQFRLFYLLIAWTALIPLYHIARLLHSQTAGVMATALGLPIIALSLYARASTVTFVCAAFALWALCQFALTSRDDNRAQFISAAIVGFLVCFGYEGHPYTLRYAVSFGLAIFAISVSRGRVISAFSWKVLAPVTGVIVGGLLYVPIFYFLHWRPVINLNSDLMTTLRDVYVSGQNYTSSTPLERMWSENNEQLSIFARDQLPIFLLTITVGLSVIMRPVWRSRLLLIVWIGAALVGVVMLAHANYHYHLFGVPFLVPLLAIVIGSMKRPVLYLTLALVITWGWIFSVDRTPDRYREVLPIAQQINQLLPADVEIIGVEPLYWGMLERTFNYRNTTDICDLNAVTAEKRPNVMLLAWPSALMGDPCAPVNFWIASAWKMQPVICFENVAGETVYILVDETVRVPSRPDLACPPLPTT